MTVPVLTLDGPSGSGKGTISIRLSAMLGWRYLDSGALYRLIGLLASQREISLEDEETLATVAADMEVEFIRGAAFLEGRAVGDEIRTEEVGNLASKVAALPKVRESLLKWQRRAAQSPGLVADGRDMGTVVFPSAECKIFLTASAQARAERRFNQLRLKGFDVTIRQLFEEISERDQRDAERKTSPLVPAKDALIIDATELSIEQVEQAVLSHLNASGISTSANTLK